MAFRDSLRRLGQRLRPAEFSKSSGGGGRETRRQPDESTVALGSSASAHEPRALSGSSRAPEAEESGSATVIAPHAPAQPSTAPQPLPAAEAPPAEDAERTAPRAAAVQQPPGSEVDRLAATRVLPADGEKPPGQVVGVLVAVEGELEGTIAPVVSGDNRLGRHPECEVSLPSEWISRHHAKIEYSEGAFTIEASSDKPTVVNTERIEGSELHDGDYITLGKTTLRFRSV